MIDESFNSSSKTGILFNNYAVTKISFSLLYLFYFHLNKNLNSNRLYKERTELVKINRVEYNPALVNQFYYVVVCRE